MAQTAPLTDPQWREPWTLDEGEQRVRGLFSRTFGMEAEHVTSSPGHLTLMGDHTDYSGGLALSTITRHRCFVAARARDDGHIRVVSAQSGEVDGPDTLWEGDLSVLSVESCLGWVRYVAGVTWALAERGYAVGGWDIAIDSCVPMGAGLGSSAALQTAVALAADACWGLALNTDAGRVELADVALEAENRFVGVPAGGLGQHTVLRCAQGKGLLLDFKSHPPTIRVLTLQFPNYGLRQLVINTRNPHDSNDGQLAARRQACESASQLLGVANLRELTDTPGWLKRVNDLPDPVMRGYARHVTSEIQRVQLVLAELSSTAPAHERFVTLGKTLYRSHASLDVDLDASIDALNLAVNTAFTAGALGSRLVGTGFGGSAVAMVRTTAIDATALAINAAFLEQGLKAPEFLVV